MVQKANAKVKKELEAIMASINSAKLEEESLKKEIKKDKKELKQVLVSIATEMKTEEVQRGKAADAKRKSSSAAERLVELEDEVKRKEVELNGVIEEIFEQKKESERFIEEKKTEYESYVAGLMKKAEKIKKLANEIISGVNNAQ